MKDRILLIIPVYNCEKQISRVLEKVKKVEHYFTEVLVIDNISQDKSIEIARKSLANFQITASLIQNKQNYSLGGSQKVGFSYAIENNHDYAIILHGDDQGNINDILPLLDNKEHHTHDCLLGSRFKFDSTLVGYSKFRIFGNWLVNLFCSFWTQTIISDTGSGLNLYSVKHLKEKFFINFPNNLTYDIYMLFYGINKKIKRKFFKLTWSEDDQISNAKVFKQAFHIIKIAIQFFFLKEKFFSNLPKNQITYDFNEIK